MSSVLKPFRKFFTPISPIPAGMYHYIAPQDDPRNYRLHLRIEPDGHGVLIINASTVLHLNQTAAEYAYYFVKNTPRDEVSRLVSQRYTVSPQQAEQDFIETTGRILALVEMPDLDPVTFLDFDRRTPYSGRISAPYRLDLALTYRLRSDQDSSLAPADRVKRELETSEWKSVLDKAWGVGIPHVLFTGGEPTLRADLAELISHAESNNQVSGLLTDGLSLADQGYLDSLLNTGLDHVMLLCQPEADLFWSALDKLIPADLFTAVHLTISAEIQSQSAALLQRLADRGVTAISLTIADASLEDALHQLSGTAAALKMTQIWDLPVPYSRLNPVALEARAAQLASRQVEGAGRAWLYVEPDGDVLPAQGVQTLLGNILNDPWEKIWRPS